MGVGARLAEPARHPVGGQSREIADQTQPPAVEGGRQPPVEPEMRQRQRGQKPLLLARWDNGRRHGQVGGDAGGELVAGNTDPDRKVQRLGRHHRRLAQVSLARRTWVEVFHAANVGVDQTFPCVFHNG